ncbi:iron complex transport system ATP-binding protein [Acetitomaculum ruminis DSM 5522]|uniref:Iron complex transport system ATP-binding protein n=1 Tax=Acetitomaculum ruminis DSM 5522 TaxID=1120918 RepID=A0A1I0WN19_9FIRM|nr:ABC transporter ATP-binding protein [Acetitomaculum ruminis]SFA90122.1 iron complex transport system ATP-binding protein [Acetitomaculum ruminis DSM 5522]
MQVNVEKVELSYGAHQILKGIDFQVDKKKFVGLIGPNGSGKSTLLKAIYRVLKPDKGAIFLNGEEIEKMPYKTSAKKLAVVSQHNYYNFDFSVMQVVLMGRAPHKKNLERDNAHDYEIAQNALKTVNMLDFSNRIFSTLSGGEQQRVILARALTQQTPCLILDEPTNHLDITYQLELMDIVKKLNATVISAIHDLNIAAMYCDEIFVLKDGKIYEKGKPREVLTRDLIKNIYNVESQIVDDQDGNMHILFLK